MFNMNYKYEEDIKILEKECYKAKTELYAITKYNIPEYIVEYPYHQKVAQIKNDIKCRIDKQMIYREEIVVKLKKRAKIRDEIKFDSIDSLREQIRQDESKANTIFDIV